MKDIFDKKLNIYCVGIGGTGLSALSTILHQKGHHLSGSDSTATDITDRLVNDSINIKIGHQASNIPTNTDLLIYSPAIPQSNPEILAALKMGIKILSYPEAVGLLTKKMHTIAICGTHGKTTTTALISSSFIESGKDPTVLVGSAIKELNNHNARVGDSNYLIIEACEYKRNFLNYNPKVIVINNIEADHLDYYKDETDYINAYIEFTNKLPENGLLIVNNDDPNIKKLTLELTSTRPDLSIVTYGQNTNSDYILNSGTISYKKHHIGQLNLQIPGIHNNMNALAAFSTCHTLKLPPDSIIKSLNNFQGADRRFQQLGKIGNATVIDDYAHHPTEIEVTLKAAREKFGSDKKLLCIFQPHQYSRTKKLLSGFAKSFKLADEVIIPNIYGVRDTESDIASINEETLVDEILKNHSNAHFGNGLENTLKQVKQISHQYDLILTLGAGDITNLAHQLIDNNN